MMVFLYLALFAGAFALRFWDLDLRPLHHDEAAFWYHYLRKILQGAPLTHVPDYHGFGHAYLNALPMMSGNDSVTALRLGNALAGTLTVAAPLLIRRHLRPPVLLLLMSFLALSPSMVFYSRQYNIFTYLTLFHLILFLLLVRLVKTRAPRDAVGFAAVAGLAAATHELAALFFVPVLPALAIAGYSGKSGPFDRREWIPLARSRRFRWVAVGAVLAAAGVFTAVMTGFFTNAAPLWSYLGTGGHQIGKIYNTGHNQPPLYYVQTLFPLEPVAFFGFLAGPFFWNKGGVFRFTILWTFTAVVGLSVIPYKIPWIFLPALLPAYILAALGLGEAWRVMKRTSVGRACFLTGTAAVLVLYGHQAVACAFRAPTAASATHPLNYAGPTPGFRDLLAELEEPAYGPERKILVAFDYHAVFWYYLRDRDVHFSYETVDSVTPYLDRFDVFLVPPATDHLPGFATEVGTYEIREGVRVKLLVSSHRRLFHAPD